MERKTYNYKQPYWVLAHQNYYKHILNSYGIEHFYGFISDGEKAPDIVVPDGCVDLSFCCDSENPVINIAGTVTEARNSVRKKGVRFFGVRFMPGYFEGWGDVCFKELQNGRQPIVNLLGKIRAFDEIITSDDFMEQVTVFLEEYFNGEFGRILYRDDNALFKTALHAMLEAGGNLTVSELSQKLFYSERRVNGVFKEHMGIGIKAFGNILRFQNALEYFNYKLDGKEFCLADIAAELGYYDQAHMTKEFRKYAHETPKKYVGKILNERYRELIQLV